MTITEGPQARKLFVDRYPLRDRLLEALYGMQVQDRILFLHGLSGTGKTLLLQDFRNFCLHKVSRATRTQFIELELPERIEAFRISQSADRFPTAYFDFALSSFESRTVPSILCELRRMLETETLHFPLFEFALMHYLRITNQDLSETTKKLVPSLFVDTTAFIADVFVVPVALPIPTLPGTIKIGSTVKLAFNFFEKYLNRWWTEYSKHRVDLESDFNKVLELEYESEILAELPRLFAEDLNRARKLISRDDPYGRIVLAFDSHDYVQGKAQLESNYEIFARDEWLRKLLLSLDLTSGILVVIAGQDCPNWQNAPRCRIENSRVEFLNVTFLARADARDYLTLSGITESQFKEKLIDFASVEENEVHPLLLGLAANAAINTPDAFADAAELTPISKDLEKAAKELIDRFLKHTDAETQLAVKALAVCRTFNFSLYEKLGECLKFAVSALRFEKLTRFSFVSELKPGVFSIHALLRKLITNDDELLLFIEKVESLLLKHFNDLEKNGIIDAEFEGLYFKNRLDSTAGIQLLSEKFEESLATGNLRRCESLVNVSFEFLATNSVDRAILSQIEGRFYSRLGNYQGALCSIGDSIKCLSEIDEPTMVSTALLGTSKGLEGRILSKDHRYRESNQALLESNVDYLRALELGSSSPSVLMSLANNFVLIGENHFRLSEYGESQSAYQSAANVFENLKTSSTDFYTSLLNRAILVTHEVDLAIAMSMYDEASTKINSAFDSLAAIPVDVSLKFVELRRQILIQHSILAKNLRALGFHREAESHLHQILSAYDSMIAEVPGDSITWLERGNVLREVSLIQNAEGRVVECRDTLFEAVNSYTKAKTLVPLPRNQDFCESAALAELSNVCLTLDQIDESHNFAKRALQLSYQAIELTPKNPQAWRLNAEIYRILAQIHFSLNERDGNQTGFLRNPNLQEAHCNIGLAEGAYVKALDLAERDVEILLSFGVFMSFYGYSLIHCRIEGAQYKFLDALALFERAKKVSPKNALVMNNIGRGIYELALGIDQVNKNKYRVDLFRRAKNALHKAEKLSLNRGVDGVRFNLIECCFALGQTYLSSGRKFKAISEFKEVLKLARLINIDFAFYHLVNLVVEHAESALKATEHLNNK